MCGWTPATRKDKVRLDLNENLWGPSPKVLQAIRNIGPIEISFYPEYSSLVKKIARQHRLEPEHVLLSNGADEAIHYIMAAFIKKGEEMLMLVPTFSFYAAEAKIRGAKVIDIPFGLDFSFPLCQVLKKINPRTRLIVLVNPNNPTGTFLKNKDLQKILSQALKRAPRSLVVLDETYGPYTPSTHSHFLGRFSNLLVVGSFSKFYGLAGLRLGYILSSKERTAALRNIMQPFSVNSLAVVAGEAALADKHFQQKLRREVQVEKKFLKTELEKIGIRVLPGAANFLLAYLGKNCHRVYKNLLSSNILVKKFNHEPQLEGYLRLTIGQRGENKLLLEKLAATLPPQALLFDMDGVLVDVSSSYRSTVKKTAEFFLKKNVSLAKIDGYKFQTGFNNDWHVTRAIIQEQKKRVSLEEIIKIFQKLYWGKNGKGLISEEKWLLPKTILKKLARHYQLAIITGRPKKEANFVLEKFDVKKYFSALVTKEDVGQKTKPDPYGILLALKKINAKRAAYIGDIPDDMRAASQAGAIPVAILPAKKKKRKRLESLLKKAGAKYIVQDISSILEVLE
jgi:histidinol-phosphate aminotransferase